MTLPDATLANDLRVDADRLWARSAWFAGQISDHDLDEITGSGEKQRFADTAERIGWRGDLPPEDLSPDAFFELHIEQEPVLENAGAQVGVVTSVQGLR